MTESKCIKFLLQIFYQSVLSENFFHDSVRAGINFLSWPDKSHFELAKKFFVSATTKTYNSAIIEIEVKIPDDAYNEIISEQEIKIFYSEYLNFLRTLELVNKLKFKPENSAQLCKEFLENKISISKKINLSDAVSDFVNQNEDSIKKPKKNVVISSLRNLSETIGGFNGGRVNVITAHTGFGKTNWGVNFLKYAIQDKKNCLYINMEMDVVDMTKRYLQAEFHMTGYDFEKENYIQKIQPAVSMDFLKTNWITDGSTMSISEISAMVSEVKRKQELDFLIVDYDQKIIVEDSRKEEWQQILKSVEALEALAKREKICVILFAQTNEDNDGAPIASKRSMQPASSVIHFTKMGNQPIMKFIKNRFGPVNKRIKFIYYPSTSSVIEDGLLEESILPTPTSGFKKGARKDPYAT